MIINKCKNNERLFKRAPFAIEKMRDVWYNKLTENLEFQGGDMNKKLLAIFFAIPIYMRGTYEVFYLQLVS